MLLPVSLTLAINCSPVSTTMAISCSPVSTTPPINFSTGDKLCWGQRSVLLCKAISGRWSQSRLPNSHEKAQRHLTHPDQRPRRPPKLLQTKTALFSFDGLRGLWSRCVGCLWMQLFMGVPMTTSQLEILPIYPLQLSPILGSSPPPWRPCPCHRQ